MKGRFYIPPDNLELLWKDADQYCKAHIPKKSSLHPPTLILPFSNEEIDMLTSLDYVTTSTTPLHLGFYRRKKEYYDFKMSSYTKFEVSQYQNVFVKNQNPGANYDNWEQYEPKYDPSGINFGCMEKSGT